MSPNNVICLGVFLLRKFLFIYYKFYCYIIPFFRSALSSMMSSLCKSIFKNQLDIIRNGQNIFQNRVLQMLFDVKFLLKLFCSNSTSKETVKVYLFHCSFLRYLSESIFTRRKYGYRNFAIA